MWRGFWLGVMLVLVVGCHKSSTSTENSVADSGVTVRLVSDTIAGDSTLEPTLAQEPVPLGITPDPRAAASPASTTPLWMLIPHSWPARCKGLVKIVAAATRLYGDPHDPAMMYMAQVKQESRCDPTAKSGVGAMGALQIMPATAADIQKRWGEGRLDPWDLVENIKAGIWFDQTVRKFWSPSLRSWCDRVMLMFSGYNSGNGYWLRAQGRCTGSSNRDSCNGYYDMAPYLPVVNPAGAGQVLGYVKYISGSWHNINPNGSCPAYDATRFLKEGP